MEPGGQFWRQLICASSSVALGMKKGIYQCLEHSEDPDTSSDTDIGKENTIPTVAVAKKKGKVVGYRNV
jgi:hypothetical protein